MMNRFGLTLGLLLISGTVQANEIEGLTLADFINEAKEDIELNENFMNSIELIDINDDGVVSENEIDGFANGSNYLPNTTEAQKQEFQEYVKKTFVESDRNSDKKLQKDELDVFAKKIMIYMLKQRFEVMDRNHDGRINLDDTPPIEESSVSIEEATKRINESLKQLETMDSEEMAKNWMNSVGQAIAQENYYIMDQNQDGCVTDEEYADYHMAQDKKDKDKSLQLSKTDYQGIYQHEKKADPFCLTKEEYISNYMKSMDIADTDEADDADDYEIAVRTFVHMDKDKDGKLTAIEYADYNIEKDNNHLLSKDTYFDMFFAVYEKDAKKGWVTKEEFIKEYLDE